VSSEAIERFPCFGGTCEVRVAGPHGRAAAARARDRLLEWHDRFTRFTPDSELSRLNADPRDEVPASESMLALVEAVAAAAEQTGGLVDGTLGREIAAAGYDRDLKRGAPPSGGPGARTPPGWSGPLPLALALRLAPRRRPAGPSPHARWRTIAADRRAGVVRRPPGVAIDSGGLAKGLFADLLAADLSAQPGFVVNCAGDLRIGGTEPRSLRVASPFARRTVHAFEIAAGAAATSGIGARAWLSACGAAAHHLLDPATGSPAFTGVVQATALAPTALEAEIRAKAALLSGPDRARAWLGPSGGVVVRDDGTHEVIGRATA
jgi:FAD:protein FMN transferase